MVMLIVWVCLQKHLGMGRLQRSMTRQIWKESCEALSKLKQERAEILSRSGDLQAAPLTQQSCASGVSSATIAMLRNVADLSENARMQLEINRSATRKFVFQVCSPLDFARMVTFFWPVFPDILHCIRVVASS